MARSTRAGAGIAALGLVLALLAMTAHLPKGAAQDTGIEGEMMTGGMGGGMMAGNVTAGGMEDMNAANVTYAVKLFQGAGINVTNSTIFAPNNDAFNALPLELMNITDLLNATYIANSTEILMLHIVPGLWRSNELPVGNTTLETKAGINITLDSEPGGILIYVPGSDVQAGVVVPDIPFMDNVVHIIDTVLLPFPTRNDQRTMTGPTPPLP